MPAGAGVEPARPGHDTLQGVPARPDAWKTEVQKGQMSKLQLIVLGNDDADPESDDRGIYVSFSPEGEVRLASKPGYEGKDSFTYTAGNPDPDREPATVSLLHTDY